MQRNIEGVTYEHGASHAGLDCWFTSSRVNLHEQRAYPKAAGDSAMDELVLYLADPDSYPVKANEAFGVLITDERGKAWPLRNGHRKPAWIPCCTKCGKTNVLNAGDACEKCEPDVADAPVSAPGVEGWPTIGTRVRFTSKAVMKKGDRLEGITGEVVSKESYGLTVKYDNRSERHHFRPGDLAPGGVCEGWLAPELTRGEYEAVEVQPRKGDVMTNGHMTLRVDEIGVNGEIIQRDGPCSYAQLTTYGPDWRILLRRPV